MNVMTRNLVDRRPDDRRDDVLSGLIYPLAITGIAQVVFPDKANGQLIERDGTVVGSRIIGQAFSSPGYFYVRGRRRPAPATTRRTRRASTSDRPTRS